MKTADGMAVGSDTVFPAAAAVPSCSSPCVDPAVLGADGLLACGSCQSVALRTWKYLSGASGGICMRPTVYLKPKEYTLAGGLGVTMGTAGCVRSAAMVPLGGRMGSLEGAVSAGTLAVAPGSPRSVVAPLTLTGVQSVPPMLMLPASCHTRTRDGANFWVAWGGVNKEMAGAHDKASMLVACHFRARKAPQLSTDKRGNLCKRCHAHAASIAADTQGPAG